MRIMTLSLTMFGLLAAACNPVRQPPEPPADSGQVVKTKPAEQLVVVPSSYEQATLRVLKHFDVLFALLGEYKDDCERSMQEVEAYVEKNKTEMQALFKQFKQLEKDLPPKQRKAFEQKMKKHTEVLMRKAKMLTEYLQRCPEHTERFVKALQVVTPR